MTPSERPPLRVKPPLVLALVAGGVVAATALFLATRPPGLEWRWRLVKRDADTLLTRPALGLLRHRSWLDILVIEQALERYREATGRYPSTEEGLEPLVRAGLLKAWPRDRWGHPYQYALLSVGVPQVRTLGADGKEGGTDADADLFGRKPPI
jgi:hypothetical protein